MRAIDSANDCAAETAFQLAIEASSQRQAKSLELRAATSLARLWRSQGNVKEAYDPLAPANGCFTEGSDTIDPNEAMALLEELK